MRTDSEIIPPVSMFPRRAVLKLAAVGFVGGAVGVGATAMINRLGAKNPPVYRFFTAAEGGLVIEICEQFIPRDDMPGATDTGAVFYIDQQLCGIFAQHQATYRRGLEAFRQTCQKTYTRPFQELDPAQKTEALRALESGQVPKELWGEPSPQAFFNLVLAHTMQGFYGSPRHGGNRDFASYRMLGLDYPQFVGQNRYKKI